MLLCPVRNCRQALARDTQRLVCARGHSFDVARSGYVNLLQPQERKSKDPGDTAEAVAARRRLHDRGVTAPLLEAIEDFAGVRAEDVVLDAGCGEGFYAGSLAERTGCETHGVDISLPAVEAAVRRYPQSEWIVANADRFIPYSDQSFSLVMSVTARMNAPEFRRVVRDDGRLLVAIPGPEDLIELRGAGRDRAERTVQEFSNGFVLTDRRLARTTAELDATGAQDILLSIYRPLRKEPVRAMRVTFSMDLLLFAPARGCVTP